MTKWLLENAVSISAIIIAAISLFTSIFFSRRSEIRARRPVLIFEYSEDGWHVENVGNGPAIDILLAFRGDNTPWKCPLRIPPLARESKYKIKELGRLNVRHLGANYSDSAGYLYSTLSVDDKNTIEQGNKLPVFKDSEITRHWSNASFKDQKDVV